MIVADSTALIALAKLARLQLLCAVYSQVLIAPAVRWEVVDQGKLIAARGVEQIEAALKERWMHVARPTRAEREHARELSTGSRLGAGETESLALASSRRLPLIVDDKEARAMAATLQLSYVGTAGVLFAAFAGSHITFEEYEATVIDLSRVMWLSPDVVAHSLRRAREMKS